MFRVLTWLVLLCLTGFAHADQDMQAKPGRLKKLSTTLEAKKYLWRMLGDADLVEDSTGKFATCLFPKAGIFQVLVIAAKGDEPLLETITIKVDGDIPTPPPPPGPDDFAAKVRAAWQMEMAVDKVQSARALASVYRYGKASLETARDWGTLFDRMTTQALAVNAVDKLVMVQRVFQAELEANLPRSRSELISTETKARAQIIFERVATILEGLK